MKFEVVSTSGSARAGQLRTSHGVVDTPAFFPVATQGAVKGILPDELRIAGVQGLLANGYHLWLEPGPELVRRAGGLHTFMGWSGAIITDSGGFQIFSLRDLAQQDEGGITFRSHLGREARRITPELAVEIQTALGADVAMVLDICSPYPTSTEDLRNSTERTVRWAERSLAVGRDPETSLFGIVQGGMDEDLRRWCAAELGRLPFDGFGIGGLSVGEPRSATWPALAASIAALPATSARYLMGVGEPEDLLEGIARGVDLFDCVLPTRLGRHGTVLTPGGRINLQRSALSEADGPIDPSCDCAACASFSVASLHHLARAREPLGMRLASIHNVRHLVRLVEGARRAILDGQFSEYRSARGGEAEEANWHQRS